MNAISAGAAPSGSLAFLVVGSSMWVFLVGGMSGLAWSVLDDRERYRMLKYLYVLPGSLLLLMLGRGTARVAIAAMGGGITLALGVTFLGVQFDIGRVDWPLLVISMVAA